MSFCCLYTCIIALTLPITLHIYWLQLLHFINFYQKEKQHKNIPVISGLWPWPWRHNLEGMTNYKHFLLLFKISDWKPILLTHVLLGTSEKNGKYWSFTSRRVSSQLSACPQTRTLSVTLDLCREWGPSIWYAYSYSWASSDGINMDHISALTLLPRQGYSFS